MVLGLHQAAGQAAELLRACPRQIFHADGTTAFRNPTEEELQQRQAGEACGARRLVGTWQKWGGDLTQRDHVWNIWPTLTLFQSPRNSIREAYMECLG